MIQPLTSYPNIIEPVNHQIIQTTRAKYYRQNQQRQYR